MGRTAFLHNDWHQPGVGSSGCDQASKHARPQPRVEIVDIGFKHNVGIRQVNIGLRGSFTDQELRQGVISLGFEPAAFTAVMSADETLRRDLHAYLAATARDLGCPAIRIGGVADHVHVVCCLARTVSLATLVAKLKVSSSHMLKSKVGTRVQWQNGYGAFSVSESALGRVVEYVANQELHHRHLSFQDEYRAFLRRHGVGFDERYVWD